ncbi:MAG: bifunctional phosphoserine phosphatase/homoserine phosphotransferase ThrH [Treponema sp.]|jgi:phosphoserine/homoserine phosphotransferase|nr:bifunctional phosphoserine phosphatase/homoserine phosphotransferase ThrH [Treponema sp.]
MHLICLDLEGVLIPELWIAFSEATGISGFRRTTRDEPDYGKLMRFRIDLLNQHHLKLADIQHVIAAVEPFPGALEFSHNIRQKTQLIILSDTYTEFALPIMKKLEYPTLLCNRLSVKADGTILDYHLRQENGKKEAVCAFKSLNIKVFAAGDSFNDLNMIAAADAGCLFRAPESIRAAHPAIPSVNRYDELYACIEQFLLVN